MSVKLPQKYQDLAIDIAKSFDLGTRMDILLIVQSKNTTRIEQAAAGVASKLVCSATDARIAMKEYVAHVKNYDPALAKELR